jgi:hypothetical protein
MRCFLYIAAAPLIKGLPWLSPAPIVAPPATPGNSAP